MPVSLVCQMTIKNLKSEQMCGRPTNIIKWVKQLVLIIANIFGKISYLVLVRADCVCDKMRDRLHQVACVDTTHKPHPLLDHCLKQQCRPSVEYKQTMNTQINSMELWRTPLFIRTKSHWNSRLSRDWLIIVCIYWGEIRAQNGSFLHFTSSLEKVISRTVSGEVFSVYNRTLLVLNYSRASSFWMMTLTLSSMLLAVWAESVKIQIQAVKNWQFQVIQVLVNSYPA